MINVIRISLLVIFAVLSAGFFFEPKVPFKKSTSALFMPAYDNLSAPATGGQGNWNHAGLADIGGIPNRTTQCGSTVSPSGITPPAANDDAVLIQNAINACTAGQVVQLAAGTFQISTSENIQVNKSITLRGTGNCTTGSGAMENHSPFCQTVIQQYDGAWPFYQNGGAGAANCGTTTATPPLGTAPTPTTCGSPFSSFYLGNPGAGYWGGCHALVDDPHVSNCGTLLAADAFQGQTTVQVGDTSHFSVGMVALIDEAAVLTSQPNPICNGTGCSGVVQSNLDMATDALSSSPTPVTQRTIMPDENNPNWFPTNRLTAELKVISAIGAGPCPGVNCTLTFDTPLTIAYHQSGSHDARMYWPQDSGLNPAPFVQQAGIENLTISRALDSPLQVTWCEHCWVKNVETAYWILGLGVSYAIRNEITHSYLHDCVDCNNDGNEYPFSLESAATENLVDDNIILHGGKGNVGRGGDANVVAYNYSDKQMYQSGSIGDHFLDLSVNASHEGGTHHWLMEGNWTANCDGDNTHGGSDYHTFFRNHCRGLRTDFTDYTCSVATPCNSLTTPQTVSDVNGIGFDGHNPGSGGAVAPGRLRPGGPMSYNYWYSFVSNVMGDSGITTAANGWGYLAGQFFPPNNGGPGLPDKRIWQSGWTGLDPPFNLSCCAYASDPHLDGSGAVWMFKNGNYDFFNGAVMDNAAGYSQAFPSSLYLSAKPAFFSAGSCTYPWPWITPTSSPFVQPNTGGVGCGGSGLPAKARWDAGTPFVQP